MEREILKEFIWKLWKFEPTSVWNCQTVIISHNFAQFEKINICLGMYTPWHKHTQISKCILQYFFTCTHFCEMVIFSKKWNVIRMSLCLNKWDSHKIDDLQHRITKPSGGWYLGRIWIINIFFLYSGAWGWISIFGHFGPKTAQNTKNAIT